MALILGAALALSACGGSSSPAGSITTTSRVGSSTTTGPTPPTVWLCRPGTTPDPCVGDLSFTAVTAAGARTVVHPVPAAASPFDCFYVYPTVSTDAGDNADLSIQASEIGAATAQAQPFSQDCSVWAPVYRQRTLGSLAKGLGADPAADAVAYQSLLAAWQDYLAHDNRGRPVILIGHSQGAAMLIRVIRAQIDNDPALRSRLVLAIIAGGNVAVPDGAEAGGSFQHVPVCTRAGQAGCVIAYSSFPSTPPAGADFGRPGQGVSLQSGQTQSAGLQVACVNPAAVGGGTAGLLPEFPVAAEPPPPPTPTTPWVEYPGLYSAACHTGAGASWLEVSVVAPPGDNRPRVKISSPAFGYHSVDINLALGNLVADVAAAESTYTASHP